MTSVLKLENQEVVAEMKREGQLGQTPIWRDHGVLWKFYLTLYSGWNIWVYDI